MGDVSNVSKHSKDQNHYPDDYTAAHKRFEAQSINKNRFVNFKERDTQSVLTVEMIKVICHGKLNWLLDTYVSFIIQGPVVSKAFLNGG